MKKKRFTLLLGINILAIVVLALVMTVSAWAAGGEPGLVNKPASSVGMAPTAGGITVTLLNVSNFPPTDAFYNGIAVYYDHNQGPQTPFFGGGWIGVDICNDENIAQTVSVQLNNENDTGPFPEHDPLLVAQNAFMLGKNQNALVTVPDIPAKSCQISYHYIFTPRFKNDPADSCEIKFPNGTLGPCATQQFYVHVTPTIGTVQTVSGTLVMDGVQTANPGAIEQVVESSEIFTLTVFFESGNLCTASGSCSGTYAPTTHYDHDAGTMHLIRITSIATDTTGVPHIAYDGMRLEGAGAYELNQDPLRFIYVFARDNVANIVFYPSYAANSGSTNYKGAADEVGIPTAITLSDLKAVSRQPQTILALGFALVLGIATIVVLRRQRQLL